MPSSICSKNVNAPQIIYPYKPWNKRPGIDISPSSPPASLFLDSNAKLIGLNMRMIAQDFFSPEQSKESWPRTSILSRMPLEQKLKVLMKLVK